MRIYQAPKITWLPASQRTSNNTDTATIGTQIKKVTSGSSLLPNLINARPCSTHLPKPMNAGYYSAHYVTQQHHVESADRIYRRTAVTPNLKQNTSQITSTKPVREYKSPLTGNQLQKKSAGTQAIAANKNYSSSLESKAYIYSPFSSRDVIAQAVSINLARVLQGKTPHPVLFSGSIHGIKQSFELVKKQIISHKYGSPEALACEYKNQLTKENIEHFHLKYPEKTRIIGEYLALKNMTFIPVAQADTKTFEKIYILGHGSAASLNITSSADVFSSTKNVKDIARELTELIKQTDRKIAIRLIACEGADRKSATSHNKEALISNAKSVNGVKPLGQHMSNALASEGVENVSVTAYHGDGIRRGNDYFHKTRKIAGIRQRAHNYRTEFFPEPVCGRANPAGGCR